MTDREKLINSLRRANIAFEETPEEVSFKTEHWISDFGFHPDGSLKYEGHGNLAAVQKLKLYDGE